MTERLYYTEQGLVEFAAEVADIRELSNEGGKKTWQIAFDRSAFYPVSGGQPFDLGELEAVSASGTKLVVPVLRVDEDESGEVWHSVEKPLQQGTAITGRVDAARRRDHMQQHTGQHLLSAIFLREMGASTVGFHLGEMSSTLDLDCAVLSAADVERIEIAVNVAVLEDRRVSASVVSRETAEAMLGRGELRKLPEREGEIRLIEIEGVEWNACGGTHVARTGEIGAVLLRKTEKVKRGVRVEFVCGMRAVARSRAEFAALDSVARTLSVGAMDVGGRVAKLLEDAKATGKEQKRLAKELAGLSGGPQAAKLEG